MSKKDKIKRRSRSKVASNENEFAKMTLDNFEAEIQRCLWGALNGGSSQGRKSFLKRLVLLEKQREIFFMISAPKRKFNSESKC